MLCVDDLIKLAPFQQLPQARLDWVCDRAQTVMLQTGDVLVHEGDTHKGLFLLIEGHMSITRRSDGMEIPIGQHNAPSFFGEIPILTGEPVPVTMRAIGDCRLYEIEGDDFRALMHECREFEQMVFRIMQQRMRGLESFIRGREKMAALGTLAAGLAHELNNPADALVRSFREIPAAVVELQRMSLVYGQRQVEEAHTQQWLQLRDQGYDAILNDRLDPATLSDREETLLEWLEDYGVNQAWKLAEPLAEGGIQIEALKHITERWRDDPSELREMGLHWLGS